MQMLWPGRLHTSAGFAVFVTSDLDSEFHTGSIYFQTPAVFSE